MFLLVAASTIGLAPDFADWARNDSKNLVAFGP